MAEIKLNDSFNEEVEAFRTSGEEISKLYAETYTAMDSQLKLPTVDEYQKRFRLIGLSLSAYFSTLIKKDAESMDKLAATLKATDINGTAAPSGSEH